MPANSDRVRFTEDEDAILQSAQREGLSPAKIARRGLVKRTRHAIGSRLRAIANKARRDAERAASPKPARKIVIKPSEAEKADLAFTAAMQRAIQTGREHARLGTFKDHTPFTGIRIQPEPMFSGCSSPAGSCADLAPFEGQREPTYA